VQKSRRGGPGGRYGETRKGRGSRGGDSIIVLGEERGEKTVSNKKTKKTRYDFSTSVVDVLDRQSNTIKRKSTSGDHE